MVTKKFPRFILSKRVPAVIHLHPWLCLIAGRYWPPHSNRKSNLNIYCSLLRNESHNLKSLGDPPWLSGFWSRAWLPASNGDCLSYSLRCTCERETGFLLRSNAKIIWTGGSSITTDLSSPKFDSIPPLSSQQKGVIWLHFLAQVPWSKTFAILGVNVYQPKS